jgi:hypothetical protein
LPTAANRPQPTVMHPRQAYNGGEKDQQIVMKWHAAFGSG